ncbi:chitinase-3-like protein 1 [Chelonus insularis]|uniref:chitinase-3-like protein 1 n=1 Tax=Chelonus insularis TaxID=460826 RepID=UPI001589872C|nr:chitinase-3-like protein 1 [Chelonus insularis]XP_034946302.1 chitinase-3-like protein 1 [Chelonus insularis]
MRSLTLLAAIFVAGGALASATDDKKVVCYFGSWAVYRPGRGKFNIDYIDPQLCTHLIYTFVGLQGTSVKVLDPWQDLPDNWGKDGFGRFNALRSKNPNLKTLVAIGGWNEGSTKYSNMAKTAESREQFAQNVVDFVAKWGFDGFDLDWEYPNQRNGAAEDVDNYIELLKVLKAKLEPKGYLLTAAVAAAESSASKSYKISEMSKYLDLINLMAYDFHGAWESQTGINAPLKVAKSESGDVRGYNVEASVNYWLSQGAPKEKLVVGVPSYGRAFTLADSKKNYIGAPTRGPGKAGPYTREPGMLGYNEICEMHLKGGWNVYFDEERRVPYTHKNDQWIGYDNVKSLREKAELIKRLDLAGVMLWSVETDDFRGVCGEKFPVLRTLHAVLRGGQPVSEETVVVSSAPEPSADDSVTVDSSVEPSYDEQPSSPPHPSDGLCTKSGNVAKPDSCDFVMCVPDGNGGYLEYDRQCGESLCYNPTLGICDWETK